MDFCIVTVKALNSYDHTEKSEQQELVEDLVQIITVFRCKLQGKRANKAKKTCTGIDAGGRNRW